MNNKLICQKAKECTKDDISILYMPDSSVYHLNLKKIIINSSFFNWTEQFSIYSKLYDQFSESNFDLGSTISECIGCDPEHVVYENNKKNVFSGEILFVQDGKFVKDIPYWKIQIVDGIKDGFEIKYKWDDVKSCFHVDQLFYHKKGKPYKKSYELEYVDSKLLKTREFSYEDGRLYGIAKAYDNSKYSVGNKEVINKEKLIYEAFVINNNEEYDCCDRGLDISSLVGLNFLNFETSFNLYDGWRKQYQIEGDLLDFEELWVDGKIKLRKKYFRSERCMGSFLSEDIKYDHIDNETIIRDQVTYFPDCKNSVEKIERIKNLTINIGQFIVYKEPGKISIRGNYNDDGEKDGKWEEFNDNGKNKIISQYTNGLKNGLEETYDDNGNLFRILRYEDDKIVEIIK